jgi:hypothetical protein
MGAPFSVSLVPFAVLWGAFIIAPLVVALPRLAKRCNDPASWGER